jgi:hypothetical protein
MSDIMDNIEEGLGKKKNTIAFIRVLIGCIGLLTLVLTYCGINYNGWQEKGENLNDKYDTTEIKKESTNEFIKQLEGHGVFFPFPFDFQFENNDFIINYSTYDEENYSTTNTSISDYPLGEYRFSTTLRGVIVLENIESRIRKFLSDEKNTKIRLIVKASADGTLPKSDIKYKGQFGRHFEIEYYDYDNNKKNTKNFIEDKTKIENIDFALFRAQDIVEYLSNRFPIDRKDIEIFVKTFSEKGGKYRRCDFSVILENVYNYENEYKDLPWGARQFVGRKN